MVAFERNFVGQSLAACAVVVVAAWLNVSRIEWAILLMMVAIVLSLEAMNSAIETTVDLISPDIHPLAGRAKDLAAGAVLISAVASVVVGLLILLPPLLEKFR